MQDLQNLIQIVTIYLWLLSLLLYKKPPSGKTAIHDLSVGM